MRFEFGIFGIGSGLTPGPQDPLWWALVKLPFRYVWYLLKHRGSPPDL